MPDAAVNEDLQFQGSYHYNFVFAFGVLHAAFVRAPDIPFKDFLLRNY